MEAENAWLFVGLAENKGMKPNVIDVDCFSVRSKFAYSVAALIQLVGSQKASCT